MHIRPADRSDLTGIATLQAESWQDVYAQMLPAEFLSQRLEEDLQRHWHQLELQPQDVVLVAEQGQLCGFIAVWCRPDPFIDNLHVHPSQRSRKIGSRLLRAAALQLRQQGQNSASLWVLEANTRAIRFYQRLGGVCSKPAFNKIFGHEVPSVKIVWSDLEVLAAEVEPSQ